VRSFNEKNLSAAAWKLIRCVEFDVNGMNGKGGNGGLTSDDTLRAAGQLRMLLTKMENGN
jgi:hypothetical protein